MTIALCAAVAACGELAGSPPPDTNALADASEKDVDPSEAGSPDASVADDADAIGPDQKPHEVVCGGNVCVPAQNQECCLNGTTGVCIAPVADPPCSWTTVCDEAADCAPQLCVLAVGKTQAMCSANPTPDDVVLCASSAECAGLGAAATICKESSCATFPYKTCGGVCPQL